MKEPKPGRSMAICWFLGHRPGLANSQAQTARTSTLPEKGRHIRIGDDVCPVLSLASDWLISIWLRRFNMSVRRSSRFVDDPQQPLLPKASNTFQPEASQHLCNSGKAR